MSAPRMVSAREAVLRERAAYLAGVKNARGLVCSHAGPDCVMCRKSTAERYPLPTVTPTVTRPRVVDDNPAHPCGEQWCVIDGTLRYRYAPGRDWMRWSEFRNHSAAAPTPGRVALWADLLANPTETVEADEAVADDVVSGREP